MLNYSADAVEVPLPRPGVDILSGVRWQDDVRVPATDLAVLRSVPNP